MGRAPASAKGTKRAALVDDVADMEAPKKALCGFGKRQRVAYEARPVENALLMIEDRQEGDPDELPEMLG